ncbi:hypothetical protein CLU79DRAFT_732346 [Phycomyces nitens]|nr:hypothetical protein CLU79DRAFT_732346 [Phycomyces nitens]
MSQQQQQQQQTLPTIKSEETHTDSGDLRDYPSESSKKDDWTTVSKKKKNSVLHRYQHIIKKVSDVIKKEEEEEEEEEEDKKDNDKDNDNEEDQHGCNSIADRATLFYGAINEFHKDHIDMSQDFEPANTPQLHPSLRLLEAVTKITFQHRRLTRSHVFQENLDLSALLCLSLLVEEYTAHITTSIDDKCAAIRRKQQADDDLDSLEQDIEYVNETYISRGNKRKRTQ